VTVGNILILVAIGLIFIGLVGVYRFKDFYSKLMVASTIDTVAMVSLILGITLRSGISWFALKALLVMIFVLFMNPIITSKIALSAREDELQQQHSKTRKE